MQNFVKIYIVMHLRKYVDVDIFLLIFIKIMNKIKNLNSGKLYSFVVTL